MKKTLYYSVRLASLTDVSLKAYRAVCFDGSKDIIPKSCVLGRDNEVMKADAYWIAAWILPKKNLQYSDKKKVWADENGRILPNIKVEQYVPEHIDAVESNEVKELER